MATYTSERQGQSQVFNTFTPERRGVSCVYASVFTSEHRGVAKIFNSFTSERQGVSCVYASAFVSERQGRFRVENDAVEGYVIYVGYDQMPDFTAAPDGFNATRPVAFAITPPGAGTSDLHVVIRARNKFGLESQNSVPTIITIDTNGNEMLGPLSAPSLLSVVSIEDEYFKVFIKYPGYDTDLDRGDVFNVYVGEGVAPVPGVDTPVATGTTSLDANVTIGPYLTGGMTYYFAVTVFRNEDSAESVAAETTLVLGADPSTPVSVPGGFNV